MALQHVSLAERRARLAVRHLLTPEARPSTALQVVQALGALHATDPATVYLTVALRLDKPSLDATEAALLTHRSVVRHHAMRRTLWVMEPHVAQAAHAGCTMALAKVEWTRFQRMLADNGMADPVAWITSAKQDALAVVEALGSATARKVAAHSPHLNFPMQIAVGKSYAGTQGAHTRLIQNLGFDGSLIRTRSTGTWVSGEYEWVSASSWIAGGVVGEAQTARAGAAVLARVYLRAFGPVTTGDLQWWAGWTGATTKQALADVAAVPVTTDIDQSGTRADAWLLPDDLAEVYEPAGWATLLPSLDPTVMGWKQREWYTGPHGAFGHTLFDRNGNAGNAIMSNGVLVGTWGQRPATAVGGAKGGGVGFQLFQPVGKKLTAQIDHSIDRYLTTAGTTVVRPRYPAPLQASVIAPLG